MNLIDGVILLNTVVVDCSTILKVLCCVLVVMCICAIGLAIILLCRANLRESLICAILVVGCLILCLVFNNIIGSYPYTKYQVTIDDSVSLNEFYDTYEVINHEGKIWTIREKE